MENIKIKGRIWIETANGLRIGKGRALLLEQIGILGSIAEAAVELKIPYRRAWGIVRDINKNSPRAIVEKHAGGKDGGSSRLTEEGRELLEAFRWATAGFNQFSNDESNHSSRREKLQDGKQ